MLREEGENFENRPDEDSNSDAEVEQLKLEQETLKSESSFVEEETVKTMQDMGENPSPEDLEYAEEIAKKFEEIDSERTEAEAELAKALDLSENKFSTAEKTESTDQVMNFVVDKSLEDEIATKKAEEWNSKNENEKSIEIDRKNEEYLNDLGIENEESAEEKELEIEEEMIAINDELLEKEKDFLEWIENGAELSVENPEKVNEYLKVFSKKLKKYAEFLKCEYVKDSKIDRQGFIDREYFLRTVSIEKLERLSALTEKGIQNLSEGELREIDGMVNGWLKNILKLGGHGLSSVIEIIQRALNSVNIKSLKIENLGKSLKMGKGLFFSVLLFGSKHFSVENLEKITGVRAPKWLKNKKED